MAEKASPRASGALYFIVGALLVAVVGLGFLYFNGNLGSDTKKLEISIGGEK